MQEGLDAFKSGQVAMQMNWFAFFPGLYKEMGPNKIGFFVNPAATKQYTQLGGQGISVVAYSDRKDDALQYLKWFAQPDVQKKWWALGGYSCLKAVLEDPSFTKSAPFAGDFLTSMNMILLYTAVNVSLAVWLLKGFIDEIPREYEEAALVDGYTRLQAFLKTVLPQAATGIAATAVFCLIFAWNEYAFAVLLTSGVAQTMPPFIPFIIGEGGQDWPAVAAGTTLFIIPIVCFTVLLRKHLLRGITFGAVRK